MEVTKAEIDAVLDAQGRFVWTPNALTLDGQQNMPCDLQPSESLEAFLRRHVPGIDSGAWSVSIGGCVVPRAMWAKTYPKHGMHIACRATVGKQAVQLVAVAALAYFSGGLAAGLYGAMGGTYVAANAGLMLSALQMGVFVAGSILINKVLGPKTPKAGTPEEAKQVHSLRSQRNSARPYEPIPVLWGEMRVVPDLASQPYTWHQSEDQYLSTILLGGVNVHSAADLAIGDTPISSYQDVDVYYNGFSGMPSQKIPLSSNMDAVPGGELPDTHEWIIRRSAVDAVSLFVDFEYLLYAQGNKGLKRAFCTVQAQYKRVGTDFWVDFFAPKTFNSNTTETRRASYRVNVPQGQYDVRVRRVATDTPDKSTRIVTLTSLRTAQPDRTDYSAFGRIGIKIKATGQLSGALDTVRVTYRAKPMPVWNGTAWVTATTRENGLSNPGAIILQTLRGIWHKGKRQFGYGLSDDQIDIDGLKAFMLHCTAKGYTYDKWITGSMSLQEFCQEVALAGMGEFSWTDGSRPTVVFVSAGQPVSAVVNMANMLKASFSVDYALSNAADGIEYQYVDRDKGFETQTLRVAAPGVTTALNPARIKGDGVTTEAHAAIMARYHLAQSLYQYKTIHFGADIEHLDYRRLSVLSVSHDLTQWGYGGRVMGAWRSGGQVLIQLDEPVPPLPTPHLGLRLPGDRDYRVFAVQTLEEAGDTLVLTTPWPAGVALPGEGDDAHDTLWCYDFKATPGYRVRVTSLEPEQDLKGAKVTCVPEGPEFWDYVLNGTYVPAPSQSVLPQHARASVKNLRVTEHVNVQGDTEWYELSALWDVEGDYDHAQVWAGVDGSELQLVDANAVGSRTRFRIDGPGQWLVEVRPFNAGGQVGQSAAVLYITTLVQRAPRNVDDFTVQELAGGLRRFAWQYTGDKPPALAGVQIRYVPGDVALSTAMWGDMTPLGQPDDVYKAQFETTRPEAGLWTFGIRAIDTAGQLSSGVVRFVANLGDSFEQVQQPDVTPPSVPTGLAATGAFATVQVSWDVPAYNQGHGHSRTEVWAGVTADIADAAKVAEAYAGPASFEWTLGGTAYVWARHVTNDGVAGDWAGPVTAQTAQDVAALGEVLKGQITQSQLHEDLSEPIAQIDRIDFGRIELLNDVPVPELQKLAAVDLSRIEVIDRIDKAGGPLGKSLLDAAASLESTQQQVRLDMNEMAQGLLEAALAADAALERITDAGVYVDPVSGQVKIYGLEATKEEVTNLEIMLDAVAGQLALKATTAYVDGKIAEAVLSPADLLLYEGLDARLVQVVQTLDSINGTLTQKANALELQDAVARLTTAENSLDALSGQIALRVTRAEYQADQNALQQRLSSAEILLNTLDVPSITATVQAAQGAIQDAERQAQALLQDILTGERNREQAQEALAFARTELSAAITEGLQAEAQQRTQLAVQFGQSLAAVQQELTSLSAADVAEAQARMALTAQVQQGLQALNAAMETEQRVRADADAAEAQARQSLKAQLEGVDDALLAAIEEEESARVTADQAEAAARQQLAARLDGKDGELQAAIVAEQAARASGDAAEATQRQLLAATVAANRTEGLDAVEAAFGAIASEQTVRANADAALAQRVDQVQAGVASNVAGIQAEQTARASADAALGQRIDSVQAVVGNNTAAIQAEQQARADALGAQALRTEALIAASQKQAEQDAERNAEALLQDIVTAEANKERTQQDIAMVRSEAAANLQEGLLAEAVQRQQLLVRIGGQEAALQQESLARATADAAEAQQRTQLAAKVDSQAAALSQESTARSTADEALAQQQQALAAQVTQTDQRLQAQIQSESQARADADAAEALQREQLAARLDQEDAALLALVEQEQQARVSGDQAEAAARQALAVRLDGKDGQLQAAIQAEQQARADAVSAEASARQTLAATVSSNHSAALAAAQAASDAAGSKGKVIFGASAPAVADRLAQNLWIDTTGGANTPKRWNGSAWAAVTDKAATDAAAAAAQAQATANNAVAAIQTEQSVRANETGHLGAQYTVRMQLGQGGQQVIGGFGLSGTSSQTAGARIDFGVLANSFWVAAPNGSGVANVKPFSVQTTAQTVNGVVVPAGVYMDAAYINNVTALWGRFGNLVADSIQATAISAGQLTAGNGVIGGSLKSSNYVAGSSGWTLRPDGVAEFSGVIVRGTVYATSGTVGGWSIGSNYLRSSNYQAGVRGVHLGSDGSVEIRSTDGSRTFNLQATGSQPVLSVPGLSILGNGSATFSGNLSGASGSFSGTLTADNIVNTSHLVNGAVSSSVASYETDVLSFRYDTETTVATVHVGTSGGKVLILAGLSLEVANGRITSSYNPRCTVRLRRNGSEVRRLEIRGEYGAASQQEAPSMRSQYATWIKEGPVALLPMVDTPPSGVNTYTITLTVAGMDTDVNITVRHRSMAAMELKR